MGTGPLDHSLSLKLASLSGNSLTVICNNSFSGQKNVIRCPGNMGVNLLNEPINKANHSVVSEFVFLGLSNSWEIQIFIFFFSCLFYVSSMMGNLLIVVTVTSDPYLHSPMYFLLANLSVIDLIFCSIAAPKMICDLFRKRKVISFAGCLAQIFFSHAVGGTEIVLLIAMAFDRYVAICKPLHYLTIMNSRMCILILVVAWAIGLIHSFIQLAFVVNLPFCGPNVLDSFYCDIPRLIKLACTDTYKLEFMVTANSGFISLGAFFLLILSYIFILATLQKHSSEGSSKALSTLTAHVTVVVLFFGPLIFFYMWPSPSTPLDKFLAIFDAVLTPFLNPVIYTFRNREMKIAIRKVLSQLMGFRKIT
nr:olfactory receptor 4F15-like isoform X2 [Microcebus murinus]